MIFLLIFLLATATSAQSDDLPASSDSVRVVDSLMNRPDIHILDSLSSVRDSLEYLESPDSVEMIIEYPDFYHEQIKAISSSSRRNILITGNQDRMHFTLRDAVRPITSFYALRFGPPGQSYSLTYLGLPPYMYYREPDHAGAYDVYQFPPVGLPDMRLFSLEQGDLLVVDTDDPMTGTAKIESRTAAFNDETAYSEAQIFKGDYSYANTDVIFKQNTNERLGWGFRIGIEKSDGYISSSAKARENFNVGVRYKLNSGWQLGSNLRFMSVDDRLAQLGRWQSVTAEGSRSLSGLTVFAMKRDSTRCALNVSAWWQEFEEKIRSSRFFLWQEHEQSGAKISIKRAIGAHSLFFRPEIAYSHVTFDHGYEYYTRVIADGGIDLRAGRDLSCLVACNYLFDWGSASRIGGTLRATYDPGSRATVYAYGTVKHVPPSDMARFLKPKGVDFNRDGFPEYNHGGDPMLKPTMLAVASAGIALKREYWSIAVSGKTGRIDDMVIWQAYEGSQGGLYQSEAVDADLYTGSLDADVLLFDLLSLKSSYTYARIEQTDSEKNLSVMPRHNAYGSISLRQHINRLRLNLVPSIEAEYHSENFRSYANPEKLGGYLLLHGKLSVRIKSFSFYYTMENILNKTHQTAYYYPSNRRVWWGIRWIFLD
jgi:hypothetical protein